MAQKLKGLRVIEASLVRSPANRGAMVAFHKSTEGREMQDILKQATSPDLSLTGAFHRGEVAGAMAELAKSLHPELPVEQALAAAWQHKNMRDLYALHEAAPLEEIAAPVGKAVPGDRVWSEIEKRGRQIVAEADGQLTINEAIDEALRRDPGLYDRYLIEQPGGGVE